MTTQMSREQAEVLNADTYRDKFTILHQSAVGVTLTPTRDPYRAIDTLRDFAFAEDLDFKVWTVLTGWQTFDKSRPDANPSCDNTVELFSAMRAIEGVGEQDGFENGIYVIMYPHLFNLAKHPGMIQCVKEYARLFSENMKRMVLLTSPGFRLPAELEDDVPILEFDTPSYAEIGNIYDRLMGMIQEKNRPSFAPEDRDRVLSAAAGMTSQEAETAISRALITNRAKLPNVSIDDIAGEVMTVKTEVVKRSEVLEVMQAEDMANVGGLENLKDWTRKRARCFGQEARDYGIDRLRGVMLAGPPGSGKSLSARAIANMLGLPLIKFDVSRVFQSLVGQSEQRVRDALKMVDAMAPCVLMIDEADKAFDVNSSSGDSGVGKRILGNILTWMQDSEAPVFTVVTANRVEGLPSEFLRRGRLDEIFSVTVPNETERLEILRVHLRKRGQDPDNVPNLEEAVERSAGFVGSEVEQGVKDALIDAFTDDVELTGGLIAEQFGNMVPLSEAFAEQFAAMETWASNNARPASSDGTGSTVPIRRRRGTQRSTASNVGPRNIGLDG